MPSPTPKPRRPKEEIERLADEMVRRYVDLGQPLSVIARELGEHPGTVHAQLTKRGVKVTRRIKPNALSVEQRAEILFRSLIMKQRPADIAAGTGHSLGAIIRLIQAYYEAFDQPAPTLVNRRPDRGPDTRGVLRWEDPPPVVWRPDTRVWAKVAADLRGKGGKWGVVDEGGGDRALALINEAQRPCFKPAGSFLAVPRFVKGKIVIYARYLGGRP